ncbi:MAG: CRISPR-associated endonuclease Cas3'', partial [Verrucomicrobiota bacterium]
MVYAHTKTKPTGETLPAEEWEPLFTDSCPLDCSDCAVLAPNHGHINKVAQLTAAFASALFPIASKDARNATDWGRLVGLWHDLGKFAPQWQTYLASKTDDLHRDDLTGKVDHSTAGAQFADASIPKLGRLIAYLIAGHHAGLANGMDGNAPQSSLEKRLLKTIPAHLPLVPKSILHYRPSTPPPAFALRSSASVAFFMRMLFSCLTDADFLATEAFMSPERATQRPHRQPTTSELHTTLQAHLAHLAKTAPDSPVNRQRADILRACLEATEKPPGLFSLTVPTGGGKTLASLAFALDHARRHDLRRVIYVIPYTSIIEQNAAVFRRALAALGPDVVLEHHASLDPDDETKNTSGSRLAAENWDARVIVTTNVQFFESLHANRTSRCRKLHRIARSVVILDEAQSLPLELLSPCLRAIEELTTHYGTSVVLCTATQPSLERRPDFKIGLAAPTEIIPDRTRLYTALQRVRTTPLGRLDDDALV